MDPLFVQQDLDHHAHCNNHAYSHTMKSICAVSWVDIHADLQYIIHAIVYKTWSTLRHLRKLQVTDDVTNDHNNSDPH